MPLQICDIEHPAPGHYYLWKYGARCASGWIFSALGLDPTPEWYVSSRKMAALHLANKSENSDQHFADRAAEGVPEHVKVQGNGASVQ